MIAQTYCGISYHDTRGEVRDCDAADGPCPSCRREHVARLEAALATAEVAYAESLEAHRTTEAEGGTLNQANNEIDRLRARNAELEAEIARLQQVVVGLSGDLAVAKAGRPRPDLADLIRKRYPGMLERGNMLYDGALAKAVEAQAAAKPKAVMEPIGCGPCAHQWNCESHENASPCSDFLPLDGVVELLMCPCCGGRPKFHKIPDGGEYIECSNVMCRLTTPLISAVMEPARPLLAEVWNRRPVAPAAAQAGGVVVPEMTDAEFNYLQTAIQQDGIDEPRSYADGAYALALHKVGARTLTASRVLGEGFVAVDEEELVALRCLDDAVTINGDGMSTEALGVDWELARSAKRRIADIRAAKGGA